MASMFSEPYTVKHRPDLSLPEGEWVIFRHVYPHDMPVAACPSQARAEAAVEDLKEIADRRKNKPGHRSWWMV